MTTDEQASQNEIRPTELTPTPAFDKLFGALAKAQSEFTTIEKTKEAEIVGESANGREYKYKYRYAALDDIIAATRPALTKHGLAVFQNTNVNGQIVNVRTIIAHESGQVWISDPLVLDAGQRKAQKIGAAQTYARRYSLSASLGVASEEDDDATQIDPSEKAKQGSGNKRKVERPEDRKQAERNQPAADENIDQRRPDDEDERGEPAKEPAKEPFDPSKSELPAEKKIGTGDAAHYKGCITAKQVKRLFSVAQTHKLSSDKLREFLAEGQIPSSDRIPVDKYDGIILAIQSGHASGK